MQRVVEKLCHKCGIDVRDQRRTRDPRGRYFCKPCWNALLAEYYRRFPEKRPANFRQPTRVKPTVATARKQSVASLVQRLAPARELSATLFSSYLTHSERSYPISDALIPLLICIPLAMCFAQNLMARTIGLAASAVLASVVIASILMLRNRPDARPAAVIVRYCREFALALSGFGGQVLLMVGIAVVGIAIAWNGTGVGGATVVAIAFLVTGTRLIARSASLHALADDAIIPIEADSKQEPANSDEHADSSTPASTALMLRPICAPLKAESRPHCAPIFARASAAIFAWNRSSDFRTSDLLSAVGNVAVSADDDESASLEEESMPIRLRLPLPTVHGSPCHIDDASSDSSVGGYKASPSFEEADSGKRAWS